MRRAVREILISLLLGVTATIAVAWGLATRAAASTISVEPVTLDWVLPVPPHWPTLGTEPHAFAAYGADEYWFGGRLSTRTVELRSPNPIFNQFVWMSGWPWHALCCEKRIEPLTDDGGIRRDLPPWASRSTWDSVFLTTPSGQRNGVSCAPGLPLRACWPGFGSCVLFYGGLAWLAVFAPFHGRDRRRRRRGACVGCGHQLTRDLARCPECGRDAITASRRSLRSA